jgi:hypothetical protein
MNPPGHAAETTAGPGNTPWLVAWTPVWAVTAAPGHTRREHSEPAGRGT